jgi:hypothetical protein
MMAYAANMPLVIGLAVLAFWLYCLFDVITTPEEDVRNLPKALWMLIALLLLIVGGGLWLVLGRPRQRQAYPARQGPPMGPDDDPEFLRELQRRLRDNNE